MTCPRCGLRVVGAGHRDATECVAALRIAIQGARDDAAAARVSAARALDRLKEWRERGKQARADLAAEKRQAAREERVWGREADRLRARSERAEAAARSEAAKSAAIKASVRAALGEAI